jgi:hypothetical protein
MSGSASGDRGRSAPKRLAVGVTLLSVTVGALVTAAAAVTGAGLCSTPDVGSELGPPPDIVCYQLVRTLSERVGVATALITAVMALTVVGLSRLIVGSGDPAGVSARRRSLG